MQIKICTGRQLDHLNDAINRKEKITKGVLGGCILTYLFIYGRSATNAGLELDIDSKVTVFSVFNMGFQIFGPYFFTMDVPCIKNSPDGKQLLCIRLMGFSWFSQQLLGQTPMYSQEECFDSHCKMSLNRSALCLSFVLKNMLM